MPLFGGCHWQVERSVLGRDSLDGLVTAGDADLLSSTFDLCLVRNLRLVHGLRVA
jgi:hypothetical protein